MIVSLFNNFLIQWRPNQSLAKIVSLSKVQKLKEIIVITQGIGV